MNPSLFIIVIVLQIKDIYVYTYVYCFGTYNKLTILPTLADGRSTVTCTFQCRSEACSVYRCNMLFELFEYKLIWKSISFFGVKQTLPRSKWRE